MRISVCRQLAPTMLRVESPTPVLELRMDTEFSAIYFSIASWIIFPMVAARADRHWKDCLVPRWDTRARTGESSARFVLDSFTMRRAGLEVKPQSSRALVGLPWIRAE